MICIADIGATKSHWRINSENHDDHDIYLNGFNFSNDDIENLELPQIGKTLSQNIRSAYIFAAGYNAQIHKTSLEKKLIESFQNLSTIYIHHDLMAACLATAGLTSGIICILGTGSNACAYDGQEIIEKIEPLGYILGDEGGGFQIGKILINDFFNQRMPSKTSQVFASQFKISKTDVLSRVYKSKNAKSYVASFAPFITEMRNPYTNDVMSTVFDSFIEKYLYPLHEKNPLPIYFVGSVAKIHASLLKETRVLFLAKTGLLVTYH